MTTRHSQVSIRNLLKDRARGWLAALALPFLASTIVGIALGTPVLGQVTSPGHPQAQVETAARSRVPKPPVPISANGSEVTTSTLPRVVFENGQLSISATDASLSEVLYALRACTGANIDIPGDVAAEHITAQLGPGPARKVLSDLLSWSSFDYVIQGSDTDPLSIQSVTLMARTKSAPSTATAATPRPALQAPLQSRPVTEPLPAPVVDTPEAENRAAEVPAANAADSLESPQSAPSRSADAGSNIPSMGSSSAKSTSDMMQELQQMYQQRRILQEQQNRGLAPVPGSPQ